MGKSIISMRAQSLWTAPSLIETMSFQLAIPWQVALPQSLPPLHQPAHILQESAFAVQFNSSERRTVVSTRIKGGHSHQCEGSRVESGFESLIGGDAVKLYSRLYTAVFSCVAPPLRWRILS